MGIVIGPGNQPVPVASTFEVETREAITDVTRQIEDLTWYNLSSDQRGLGLDEGYQQRVMLLKRIRTYRKRSPLAKLGARLLMTYVLGQGISLKANNRVQVARIVDEFWEDPVNQAAFTSTSAMSKFLDRLMTDGDQFVVLFPAKDKSGTLRIAILEALFVEDIITDPENWSVPLWYKVRKDVRKYDFQLGAMVTQTTQDFVYYRDWRNDATTGFVPKASQIAEGLIYHVAINQSGKFGESEFAASMDWLKAHKEFMENRATLNAAAAQIAWKKTRKGPAAQVAQDVNKLQSSLVNNINAWESNPPPVPGSTYVRNEGVDLEWMKTDTGGDAALADERILRMMAGAGMGGVPNHYFGDEANANLATATAMELPLLKNYENWQMRVKQVVEDILDFLLSVAHEAGRIGPRDDSSKYSEHNLNPEGVLSTIAEAMGRGDRPEVDRLIAEAFTAGASPMPGPKVSPGSPGQTPAPAAPAGDQIAIRDPAVQLSMMKRSEPTSVGGDAIDNTGPIDWFIAIDFPPIIQKDAAQFTNALKTLYELLPTQNIESQKLVVRMALTALGETELEQVMDLLFPPGMTMPILTAGPLGILQPGTAATLAPAAPALLGPGPTASPNPLIPNAGSAPVTAPTDLNEARADRVRRVIGLVREAQDAIAIGGG